MINLKNKPATGKPIVFFSIRKGISVFAFIILSSLQCYSKNKAQTEYDRYLHYVDSVTEAMYNFKFTSVPNKADSVDAATRMVGLYSYYYEYLSAKSADIKPKFDALLETPTNYNEFDSENVKLAQLSEQLVQMRYARARGNYLSSAFLFSEAGKYFNTNKMDTTVSLSLLYWGLYSYYLSAIKEESIFFRGLLSGWHSADKDDGLKILSQLVDHESRFISTEAKYFLMRGLWELDEQPKKALLLAESLCKEYPLNLLYHWFRIRIIAEVSGEDAARQAFKSAIENAKRSHLSAPVLDLFQERCDEIWD